jgi:hypothetical protein
VPSLFDRTSGFDSARDTRGTGDREVETYGRIGVIECAGRPAIELLEIVSPDA